MFRSQHFAAGKDSGKVSRLILEWAAHTLSRCISTRRAHCGHRSMCPIYADIVTGDNGVRFVNNTSGLLPNILHRMGILAKGLAQGGTE